MTANVLSTWYEITTPTTGSSRRALQAVHRDQEMRAELERIHGVGDVEGGWGLQLTES